MGVLPPVRRERRRLAADDVCCLECAFFDATASAFLLPDLASRLAAGEASAGESVAKRHLADGPAQPPPPPAPPPAAAAVRPHWLGRFAAETATP